MPKLHLLRLQNVPILEQLKLEEALLRTDRRNWCLFNAGADPAIVMGISAKPEKVINAAVHAENPVPVIRRFSGGGTVFIDENTLFATLICQKEVLEELPCFPRNILQWTGALFPEPLVLRENDYAIGEHKFGGNALYIRKERWLHHMSLLWDYDLENMDSLAHPERVPDYRGTRSHGDFLCRLKDHLPSPDTLFDHMVQELNKRFTVVETQLGEAQEALKLPHRQTLHIH